MFFYYFLSKILSYAFLLQTVLFTGSLINFAIFRKSRPWKIDNVHQYLEKVQMRPGCLFLTVCLLESLEYTSQITIYEEMRGIFVARGCVTGLASVVPLVIEVHVLNHQGLAVVVVGCPALRQCTPLLCPSVNKQSLDTGN